MSLKISDRLQATVGEKQLEMMIPPPNGKCAVICSPSLDGHRRAYCDAIDGVPMAFGLVFPFP